MNTGGEDERAGIRMLDTRFVGQNRFYMHNNFLFAPIGPKIGLEVRTGVL